MNKTKNIIIFMVMFVIIVFDIMWGLIGLIHEQLPRIVLILFILMNYSLLILIFIKQKQPQSINNNKQKQPNTR